MSLALIDEWRGEKEEVGVGTRHIVYLGLCNIMRKKVEVVNSEGG